ncbi:MAG: protoporphyrinogen oxidase HemJ [Nitratiruptor sp.]|nr:protoporphyrinogen oxidase HemJ [Nitratiruptor sp.]NPA83613.1 protoporphyrinogen oxidase HemJ [Campylobacterota bacterium]
MAYYNWILAFHVMAVISWMAMLFYLPRLFVYHVEHRENEGFVQVVKIQEAKLYRYIGIPAFWATLLSGTTLIALNPALFKSGLWLHIKLSAALALLLYHLSLGFFLKRLAQDRCTKSGRFFRIYNEIPTLLMIIIVTMAVVKPV